MSQRADLEIFRASAMRLPRLPAVLIGKSKLTAGSRGFRPPDALVDKLSVVFAIALTVIVLRKYPT